MKSFALFSDARGLPPIPATSWMPPGEFPRLEAAKVLAIDTETKDPNLLEKGPGSIRRDGHIVGISVGTEDGARFYFPMRHEVGGGNMDADQVLRWAKDELGRPGQTKVGANLLYDCEWLASEGVAVAGPFIDVQYQEALLDENAKSYSLETLAQKYLGEGKQSNALYQWCAAAYGGQPTGKQRANIWRAPAALVGPYAESDVDLPLRLAALQQKELADQRLSGVADLENALIPMLLAMRRRGVRVDVAGAHALDGQWGADIEAIKGRYGVNPWNAADIARQCVLLNLPFNKTATGAPSFTKEWLAAQTHPLLRDVARARKLDKARGTFIKGHVLSHLVGDRIHVTFNPLRKDDGGTVSGRFSSTHHNLPKRDEETGTLIRSLFLPEEGEDWVRLDYAQIEPRLQFHAAKGPQAVAMRARLAADPALNCYRLMMLDMEGLDKDHDAFYSTFKGVWLGISYAMGLGSMAAHLGVSVEQARTWRESFPAYITALAERASRRAEKVGHITTLLGRRARFHLWESRNWEQSCADGAMEEAVARAKYGPAIRRAYTHKALNRYAQGSAADIMKKAMMDIWQSGVCAILGPPSFTIHDELDFSVPRTKEARAALDEVQHIMEHCVSLRVPLRAEREDGPNWGELTAFYREVDSRICS